MGIFSSKTKIQVSSVAYNIAGDVSERNNFLKHSLIYLTTANESIGERLPRMYLGSLGVKLKRAYKHAASLPQGLPTASVQLWEYQEFEDAVQTMLDVEHGAGKYKVEDAYITEGNTAPEIERYLNDTYGWDSVTGLMASPPANLNTDAEVLWVYQPPQERRGDSSPKLNRSYKVEFRNNPETVTPDLAVNVSLSASQAFASPLLVVMISERVESTRSDVTVSRGFLAGDVDSTTDSDSLNIAGSRETTTTTTVINDTDGVNTTIQTRIVDVTLSEKVSRKYVLGTGAWPTLDSLWESQSNIEQTYFPSIPFRVDNKDAFDEKDYNSVEQKNRRKLVSLMGMDAIALRDQINDNADIKDIDYAFLVAGANMNTESQAEMDYLFRFWELCEGRQTAVESDIVNWRGIPAANRGKPKTNSLVIEDPESKDGAYKVTIEWDYVKKVLVTGVVAANAKVGQMAMAAGSTVTEDIGRTSNRSRVDNTIVSIRRQINETQYEELQISGAVHKNSVYKGKVVETLAKDARADAEEHEGFIIPLHMAIFNNMPLIKRTQLAQECIYLVFNCYVKTKKKWYQSGIFRWIAAIVGIIVIIATWGTGTPGVIAAWAATYGATLGLVIYIAATFAIGYMSAYLVGKWAGAFEAVFGKKWAAVVMATLQLVIGVITSGSGLTSGQWLQNAVRIIDIATSLFSAYVKGAMTVRAGEYDAFMDRIKEDQKLLDQLSSEFFGDGDMVSIDYLLELQKTLREDSPTTFLSRTLMVGSDVVDITLGQISEMVSMNTNPRLQGIV